jgi:fatty-acyl-CoA synthase
VWHYWQTHAKERPEAPAVVCYRFEQEPRVWTWGKLWERAGEIAARLVHTGIRAGDVCATIMHQDFEFFPLYLAIVRAGAIPTILAYPNPRLHPEKFRLGLEGMLTRSGFDWILTVSSLQPQLDKMFALASDRFKGVILPHKLEEASGPPPLPAIADPNATCLIQHSSGTTGLQKPVALSHRVVVDHMDRLARAIELTSQDKVASWLPLYHDMGLIAAFHLPLYFGISTVQLDPFEWVKAPFLLLEAISKTKSTLCWLPNFSYNFTAECADREAMEAIRLDSIRMLINCSEPVHEESHQKFLRRFAQYGFRSSALGTSYAMAEATFAVTQTKPGVRAHALGANRQALASGRFEEMNPDTVGARVCTSSGSVIDDCAIKITGPDGSSLDDGYVGEVLVRSQSLFSEYRNRPEETAAVLKNGCYSTGDLAFTWKGELYVVGRRKDIIIVAGKNLYPQDIEAAVETVNGVIAGRVAAFGIENESSGTEDVCVIAETSAASGEELRRIRMDILLAGMSIDVTINRVELVKPRTLVKSSAGKIARSTNRDRLLRGLIDQAERGGDADVAAGGT